MDRPGIAKAIRAMTIMVAVQEIKPYIAFEVRAEEFLAHPRILAEIISKQEAWGHDLVELYNTAMTIGLNSSIDINQLVLLNHRHVTSESRYINKRGWKTILGYNGLEILRRSLFANIRSQIRKINKS